MIFNTVFDKIYVLNLKESTDRRAHIEAEFTRVGITKYDFFEAVSSESDEVKKMMNSNFVKKFPNCFRCDKKRCSCENNFLTKFQIGNWCSFLKIFVDIINNNYNFVLICEDDIVFTSQYERIVNKLLSKETFKFYNIDANKPLLIKLGTAFNDENHNANITPVFIKNYSLCNPCFAINKEMAHVYLSNLKIIDYHSDIYFHKKIPKNIPNVQHFTMYPYPVYELSFVRQKQKFVSTVRPQNSIRRLEYYDFLFLSSNPLISILAKKAANSIRRYMMGHTDSFILESEHNKLRNYYQHKFLIFDSDQNNIKAFSKDLSLYKDYIKKIKEVYDVDIELDDVSKFYEYYMKLLDLDGIKKININNEDDKNILYDIVRNDNIKNDIEMYYLFRDNIVQ